MHVHVHCGHGEAKFWMEPKVELAHNSGLTRADLRIVENLIEGRKDEIKAAWRKHFGG
jgi:hypothetical protein